jgi:hypothetical protein
VCLEEQGKGWHGAAMGRVLGGSPHYLPEVGSGPLRLLAAFGCWQCGQGSLAMVVNMSCVDLDTLLWLCRFLTGMCHSQC